MALDMVFVRPWSIRLPTVVRRMPSQYVDAFFDDGSLRLSTFEYFRKHPDEAWRDEREGGFAVATELTGGGHGLYTGVSGHEAYILCGSVLEPKPLPADSPFTDFRILDTLSFANAISRQIRGFVNGVQGHCTYRQNLTTHRIDHSVMKDPKSPAELEQFFEQIQRKLAPHMVDAFFRKNISYADEAEYRFIWVAEGSLTADHICIKCPAAIEFCEPIAKAPKDTKGTLT